MSLVSIDDVRAAAKLIDGAVMRTPLISAPWAGDLRIKPENLQLTGAFKMRGAFNAVSRLGAEGRAHGIVADSSGNHAQAVAWAARSFGVPAVIVMPDASPPVKIDATRALGAEVVLVPAAERASRVRDLAAERGMSVVLPFDNLDVIAGQGTVGLEIAEDLPDVETVLVPVGGGGLISGVAVAVKALCPRARVVGVEPELAADVAASLAAGRRVRWDESLTFRTIADGVRTPLVGELTWPHIQALVDDVVTVSEDDILDAMSVLARRARLVSEPSGALATAAFLATPGRFGRSVAVLSGGTVDPALLVRALSR